MLDQKELIELYFPGLNDKIFKTSSEQIEAWCAFTDLLCLLAYDEQESDIPTIYARYGHCFSDGRLIDLLSPPDLESDFDIIYSKDLDDLFYTLYAKGYGDADGRSLFPLSMVLAEGLSRIEAFAVILSFVAGHRRKYEYFCRVLSDEMYSGGQSGSVTVGLCMDLARYFIPKDEINEGKILDPDSKLNLFLFTSEAEITKAVGVSRRLILRDRVISFISGNSEGNENTNKQTQNTKDEYISHKDVLEEVKLALNKSRAIELDGDEGSGRRFLLSRAAAELGKTVAIVDMKLFDEMKEMDKKSEYISELMFGGCVRGRIPYLYCQGDQELYAGALRELFSKLYEVVPTVVIGAQKPTSESILGGAAEAIYRIAVPETRAKSQAKLWQSAAEDKGLKFPKDYDLNVLVSKYVMSPGRIFETMENVATAMGENKKKIISEDILEEQIRKSCSVQFGESATRLASPFVWEDLMISPESERLLRMAANRVKYRTTVNEDFGFAKKLPYGRGVAIVFYGPPGTGKTMAAQVLANELGLDIYRIDLSQVSSKYIGETEKNLGGVFEAAKNSNAILFFDEADALFSKRTAVSSSNDKFANAETSYLLQKIEEYTGISVLATNNMQNFDAAFRRRMTFVIAIEAPDENTRARLWEAVFPKDAPLDPNINIRILARIGELNGASIKSAAVTAAYLAATEGRSIGWEDLIAAVEMEGVKTGKLGLGSKLREEVMSGREF